MTHTSERKNIKTKYDHKTVETKWQKKWKDVNLYSQKSMLPISLDQQPQKAKFYNLFMFPYPSAEGLHVGHAFSSTGSDIYGRYQRMLGKIVFEPMGFDSFGIHSENFAIKINDTPWNLVERAKKNYTHQLSSLGNAYDWNRTVTTSDIDYYKWTQWLFVQLFKAGLAYRKKSPVNWCPGCKTVLADEQIMTPTQAGKLPLGYDKIEDIPEGVKVCERCGSVPEVKELEQWFFRITDYADRLLESQAKIDWSERVAVAQRNWIGKSEGVYIEFEIKNSTKKVKVFTTAIETIFGATFIVMSPDHPLIAQLELPKKYTQNVKKYIKQHKSTRNDTGDDKKKTGVFTGLFAINPMDRKDIPIWISNYVLMEYGTGAIMAVPAHDIRDHEFAQNFDLPIVPVIEPTGAAKEKVKVQGDEFWDYSEIKLYKSNSKLIGSETFNDMTAEEAKEAITRYLEESGIGLRTSHYHLRDWLISRQRYWGPPIPMIHCSECERGGKSWFDMDSTKNKAHRTQGGKEKLLHKDQSDWNPAGWYPVPEDQLPVALPIIEDYKPKGEGRGPLAAHPEFYECTCPGCGAKAKRETDVSDTFLDSSWYFLRYPTVESDAAESYPFDPEITKKWLPVDLYFGGAEHAVLHLMYARFVTKVLYDLELLNFDEPFPRFYAHGLLIKDGAKMSKSKGNVVNPDEYIEKFGADTLRLYFMFMGPMDGYPDFRDSGVEGMRRFVERVWKLCNEESDSLTSDAILRIEVQMHKTIKRVTSEVENFRYNTAIAAIMEYVNLLRVIGQRSNGDKSSSRQTEPDSKMPNDKQSLPLRGKSQMLNGKDDSIVWLEAMKTLVQLLAPFAPHMTEELWVEKLGQEFSVHTSKWPAYDESFLEEENVQVVVQVNGKVRANITVQKDDSLEEGEVVAVAMENEQVKKWISDNEIKKTVFVPGKLVNFVV